MPSSTTHPKFDGATNAVDVAVAFADRIKDKTILITGVNKLGIGFTTAEAFASEHPSTLILCGRNQTKVEECITALRDKYPDVKYKYLSLDLSSQNAVRKAAEELMTWDDVPKIDIMVNNAAVMFIPERSLSVDGTEMHFATNHVGHFLFTNLLMPKIIAAAEDAKPGDVRIVTVGSSAAAYSPVRFSDINFDKTLDELPSDERSDKAARGTGHSLDFSDLKPETLKYHPRIAYAQSKSANTLFGVALNKRLANKHGILSLGLHPGGIMTELIRHIPDEQMPAMVEEAKKSGLTFKTPEQGSSTTVLAALDPKLKVPEQNGWGAYLDNCQISDAPGWFTNAKDAERLWALSEDLVGQKFAY